MKEVKTQRRSTAKKMIYNTYTGSKVLKNGNIIQYANKLDNFKINKKISFIKIDARYEMLCRLCPSAKHEKDGVHNRFLYLLNILNLLKFLCLLNPPPCPSRHEVECPKGPNRSAGCWSWVCRLPVCRSRCLLVWGRF